HGGPFSAPPVWQMPRRTARDLRLVPTISPWHGRLVRASRPLIHCRRGRYAATVGTQRRPVSFWRAGSRGRYAMRGNYSGCSELSPDDRAFLDRVVANLPLLA